MEPRIAHPTQTLPGAMQALHKLDNAAQQAGVPVTTHALLKLRADETQLAALVLSIAAINTWNRLNVATRQLTGDWVEQVLSREPAGAAA